MMTSRGKMSTPRGSGQTSTSVNLQPYSPGRSITGSHYATMGYDGRQSELGPPAGASSEEPGDAGCDFCNRPSSNILCQSCGYIFQGRVSSRCQRHPNLIYLMDLHVCPTCKGCRIKEFGPLKVPASPKEPANQ